MRDSLYILSPDRGSYSFSCLFFFFPFIGKARLKDSYQLPQLLKEVVMDSEPEQPAQNKPQLLSI